MVAAGIFGSSDGHTEYIPVTPSNKFTRLQSDDVDVLTSGTTHTMERQVYEVSIVGHPRLLRAQANLKTHAANNQNWIFF